MTTPIWVRLNTPDELLKKLEDLNQLKNSGIIRNPLNPSQIAVVDPAPQRINDSPVVATPPPGVETSWGSGVSPPRRKNPEEALGEAIERLEEQRRREAELFERLDQLKSTRPAVPRLIELPEPPLAIPPWRWIPIRPFPIIQPIKPLESETYRKVPA